MIERIATAALLFALAALTALPSYAAFPGTVLPVTKGGTGATSLSGAGIATLSASNTFTAAQAIAPASGTTATYTLTSTGSADAQVVVNRASTSQQGLVRFQTNGTNKWVFGLDSTATNTAMRLYSYNEGGTGFYPLVIGATTGTVQISPTGGGSAPGIQVGSSGTAISQIRHYTPSIDPASIAAATVVEQTFTVSGLTTADTVSVNPPSTVAAGSIVVAGVRVSTTDTLAVAFHNPTVSPVDLASGTWRILAHRI